VDPKHLLASFGTLGLFAIIFAETGLLVGFFLPGDSLLFTAGLLSASGVTKPVHLNLAIVLPGVIVAALAGAQVGYYIGKKGGPALFRRPDSRLFKHEHVEKAGGVLDRYGAGRAIVIARFIPIVRTFLNPMAGVVGVETSVFTTWNVVGGVLWAGGVTLAGYVLGSEITNVDRYLYPIIGLILVLSVLPILFEVWRSRRDTGAG
jgi:membrane-associated protein